MTLTDRMNHQDRRETDLTPIVERRGGDERRLPVWLRRQQEQGQAKDLTGSIKDAA